MLTLRHSNAIIMKILFFEVKYIMSNERWNSPFPYTLAFNLFRKHFTELNQIYWSFVPAYNTIISKAKKQLINDDADPKTFFLIPDEDDRRIAPTFEEWKSSFNEFSNYTRLNMVMLLSSCFETYLRTVISNAFESKPGVIIMCPDSVDGVFLLKSNSSYGNSSDKKYQFVEKINDICQGDWVKRLSEFKKYFGDLPDSVVSKIAELNEFRILRNNIGHYFGRNKADYSTPLFFKPISAIRVSHNKILNYFRLINSVARQIDKHLKDNYIGSYDIFKLYLQFDSQGFFKGDTPGEKARKFQKILGQEGFLLPIAYRKEFYRNLIDYCNLNSATDCCRYSKKICIKEINRQLNEKNIQLYCNSKKDSFNQYHFNLFVKYHNWKSDPEYCQINSANTVQTEYRYSMKLINEIVQEICASPNTIINKLKHTPS